MLLATLPRSYLIHEKLKAEARQHGKSFNFMLETDVMTPVGIRSVEGRSHWPPYRIGSAEGLAAVPLSGPEQKPFTI